MSDTYQDMYSSEAALEKPSMDQERGSFLLNRGLIKDITIDGKTISVVDAAVVIKLENLVRTLAADLTKVTNDLRSIRDRMSINERKLSTVTAELDNKVSYE
jgi:hypothetical protein